MDSWILGQGCVICWLNMDKPLHMAFWSEVFWSLSWLLFLVFFFHSVVFLVLRCEYFLWCKQFPCYFHWWQWGLTLCEVFWKFWFVVIFAKWWQIIVKPGLKFPSSLFNIPFFGRWEEVYLLTYGCKFLLLCSWILFMSNFLLRCLLWMLFLSWFV